jgi:serine/threonine protein kinase/Tol biopolymer transport system component
MLRHYEIIRSLGSGGTSEVLLARDTRLGRLVAIKILLQFGGERAQRFLTEARATAQLSHENIVVIYELGEHEGMPFMVLEYLKGKTLRQWLNERKKRGREGPAAPVLPPSSAIELMIPVVRALACAHEHGVVHRDLKPPNILLTDTGTIKVLDFGIAKLLGASAPPDEEDPEEPVSTRGDSMAITQAGAMLGTMPYMSPEQWGADTVDERSDIWAVGILLVELLLGKHLLAPLTIKTLRGVRELDVPMPSLREMRPDLGKIASIVDRCLIKRKEDRLANARELCAELTALVPAAPRRSFADEDENPYTGLSAFQQSDAARFFGRARAVTEVVTRLSEQPLLAIVGPSGAGKSSFVRAGVIPALERTGEAWETFILRPGLHPLTALAELLLSHSRQTPMPSTAAHADEAPVSQSQPLSPFDRGGLVEKLRAEPGLLGARLRMRARRKLERVLLFVDQFEELYTLAAEDERAAFFACLAGVVDDVGSPLRAVVAIRSDFLDRVAESHATMTGLSRGLMLLSPMDREGLREALVRPLEALEYRFEHEGLVDEILDALEHTSAALPLLQFTAAKLWECRDRGRRVLTEASYREIGGVAGTLAGHADAVLRAMTPGERKLARAALLRLITPERTRALCTQRELRELGAAKEEMDRVLGRLIDARLLAVESKGEADATIEIVHESLIATLPTLSRWIADNQEDVAFLSRLRHASREWEARGQAEDLLWRGQAALEAQRWHERNAGELSLAEERYLQAVFALAERSLRQGRSIIAGSFTLLVLVTVAMSSLAFQARAEAERARDATRLSVAREHQADPTAVLALLREIEGHSAPRGWSELVKYALDTGVARAVLLGHSAVVSSATWSPDGERVASASWDHTARVWSAGGGGEPIVLQGHSGIVTSVAWSPDGGRIASASNDDTVRVWSADGTGVPLVLQGHSGIVTSVAWSPDGRRIASASNDDTVRVWSADGTGVPLVLQGHSGIVTSAAWSPDGRRIASASNDDTVRVWSADGTGVPLVLQGHSGIVTSAAWSPDGRRIASASTDDTVRVWSADGAGVPVVLQGHAASVTAAAWSPDGRRIASASTDRTVRVWSADGRGSPLVLQGHAASVTAAAWSPDGARIVSASEDKMVRIWSARDGEAPLVLPVEPRDPRLWTATTYCLPVAERQRLLGLSEELSQAQYEGCRRRVAQAPRGR